MRALFPKTPVAKNGRRTRSASVKDFRGVTGSLLTLQRATVADPKTAHAVSAISQCSTRWARNATSSTRAFRVAQPVLLHAGRAGRIAEQYATTRPAAGPQLGTWRASKGSLPERSSTGRTT